MIVENQIALVAGEGLLPVAIASRLTDQGTPPVVYSIREQIGELSKYALDVVNITKPDFGFTINDMKKRGVRDIIMAGTVSKTLVFKPSLFDLTTQRFLASLVFRDDHSILGAIVDFLEKQGFRVLSYRDIIPDLLARKGTHRGTRAVARGARRRGVRLRYMQKGRAAFVRPDRHRTQALRHRRRGDGGDRRDAASRRLALQGRHRREDDAPRPGRALRHPDGRPRHADAHGGGEAHLPRAARGAGRSY